MVVVVVVEVKVEMEVEVVVVGANGSCKGINSGGGIGSPSKSRCCHEIAT